MNEAAIGTRGWRGAIGIVLLFVVWELVVRAMGLPAYVLPSVSSILLRVVTDARALGADALVTLAEALGGFALGSILGVALAILLVLLPFAERVLLPLLVAINSVPVVGWAPLALLWFGIGPTSKVAMVTMVVGFTVLLNTLQGLKGVDPAGIALLRSFGAGKLGVMRRLQLPAALPGITTGMRVSCVRAMIITIVTEMLGAYQGLGWTIYNSVQQIDFLKIWAAIFVASALSLAFYQLVAWIERRVVFWS